jgi:dynein heavy chain
MRDNNVPKLTADDTPLFMGILSDLFPGVEIAPSDYSEFEAVLEEELKILSLQSVPGINSKVIQLFETKLSRHGTMIVGEVITSSILF